jgi:hypothetical protein
MRIRIVAVSRQWIEGRVGGGGGSTDAARGSGVDSALRLRAAPARDKACRAQNHNNRHQLRTPLPAWSGIEN